MFVNIKFTFESNLCKTPLQCVLGNLSPTTCRNCKLFLKSKGRSKTKTSCSRELNWCFESNGCKRGKFKRFLDVIRRNHCFSSVKILWCMHRNVDTNYMWTPARRFYHQITCDLNNLEVVKQVVMKKECREQEIHTHLSELNIFN